MALLYLSSDSGSLNSDLSKSFHSFEAKFVEVQRPQFLFEKALRPEIGSCLRTLSLDLVLYCIMMFSIKDNIKRMCKYVIQALKHKDGTMQLSTSSWEQSPPKFISSPSGLGTTEG